MSNKQRLDIELTKRGLTTSRSQAESWVKLGEVTVGGKVITKPGHFVSADSVIKLNATEQYVSRAGLKLASVTRALKTDFRDSVVLDVGSSTGGFTDYALQHGARKVIAVDVGTDQLHQSLRGHPKIELFEKTDIRGFTPSEVPTIVVIDVSFISLRDILPSVAAMIGPQTSVLAMVKPQFEASRRDIGSSGVVKNDTLRRTILKNFEAWTKSAWRVIDKADSEVAGTHGNRERFYHLKKTI